MPINWSDVYYDNKSKDWREHAPACTCWRCVEGRNKAGSGKKSHNIRYSDSYSGNVPQVNPPYIQKPTPTYIPVIVTVIIIILFVIGGYVIPNLSGAQVTEPNPGIPYTIKSNSNTGIQSFQNSHPPYKKTFSGPLISLTEVLQ